MKLKDKYKEVKEKVTECLSPVLRVLRNKWFKLGFWSLLYLLWVIWVGRYWLIIGLGIVFDMTVTKKVNWTFWNPRDPAKRNKLTGWIDAIIFAVIVVTFINTFFIQAFKIPSPSMESSLMTGDHLFVSKLAYGPRMPMTPLTIPFTHNVIGSGESYSTAVQNDYRRLKGFDSVQRNDIVVFGFPNGDLVLAQAPADDYYALSRTLDKRDLDALVRRFGPLRRRPLDKVDHYVKRCVAVAGDYLMIKDGVLYVNNAVAPVATQQQTSYTVTTTGSSIREDVLDKMGINMQNVSYDPSVPGYREMHLSRAQASQLEALSNVTGVEENIDRYYEGHCDSQMIFPYSPKYYPWTRDNYGPIWVPSKGATVTLTTTNLPLYETIITRHEGHKLEVEGEVISIDGKQTSSYTFAQDYYFMMGDNRHNSLDSRYWGFVPETHIVGKPMFVWLSTDPSKHFPFNIRWNRFLKSDFD